MDAKKDFTQAEGRKQSIIGSFTFMAAWLGWTKRPNSFNPVENDYFNWIAPGIILGSIAMEKENDEAKIKAACKAQGRPLGLVVGAVEPFEMTGTGQPPATTPVQWGSKGVTWLQLPLRDFEGSADQNKKNNNPLDNFDTGTPGNHRFRYIVDEMLKTIARGQSVYLHCKAGKARSWILAMVALMSVYKLSFDEASLLIELSRPQVAPGAKKVVEVSNAEAACRGFTPSTPIQPATQQLLGDTAVIESPDFMTEILSTLHADPSLGLTENSPIALTEIDPADPNYQALSKDQREAIDDFNAMLRRIVAQDERSHHKGRHKKPKQQAEYTHIDSTDSDSISATVLGSIFLLQALAQKTIPALMDKIIPRHNQTPSQAEQDIYRQLVLDKKAIEAQISAIIQNTTLTDDQKIFLEKITMWSSRPQTWRKHVMAEGAHAAWGIASFIAVLFTVAALLFFGAVPGVPAAMGPFMQTAGMLSGELISSLIVGSIALVVSFFVAWPATSAWYLDKGEAKIAAEQSPNDQDNTGEMFVQNDFVFQPIQESGFVAGLLFAVKTFVLATAVATPGYAFFVNFGMDGFYEPLIKPFIDTAGSALSGDFLSSLAMGAAIAVAVVVIALIIRSFFVAKTEFNHQAFEGRVLRENIGSEMEADTTNTSAMTRLKQENANNLGPTGEEDLDKLVGDDGYAPTPTQIAGAPWASGTPLPYDVTVTEIIANPDPNL